MPRNWLLILLKCWDVYSVPVICNLDFRLDMNLLFFPPGRIHTISVSHPSQHTYSCHSPRLGLSVKFFFRKPIPCSPLWFFLTSVLQISPNSHSSFFLPFRGQCVRTWLWIMPMDAPAQNIFSLLVKSWSSESSDWVHSTTGFITSTVFQNNKHLHMENLSQQSFLLTCYLSQPLLTL